MVSFISAWEDGTILPKLRSNDINDIVDACRLLIEDDTGDVDEVKVELAKLLLRRYT